MRARAASTVAAVMRSGMKEASGRGVSGGASGGLDSEMAEASPRGGAGTSSPRYRDRTWRRSRRRFGRILRIR